MLPISLVVITYNEADTIGRCLDSVDFAAEKIVVDCGSDDDTCEVAMAHGAHVVEQDWLGFGGQRNFAHTVARYDWILSIDADEALTPQLLQELKDRLPSLLDSEACVGIIYRTAWFMGRPLHWYRPMVRERKARIYHRARARWSDVRVHESLQYQGGEVVFKAPLMHFLNPTLVHHELKMLRYAELKALDWRDRRLRVTPLLWPFVFCFAFLKDYVLRLAVLDGWRGWIVAYLAAEYAVYKRLRHFEMLNFAPSVELARQTLRAHNLER
jgi:glycosyltransferase involved in cell wall biosynthesis